MGNQFLLLRGGTMSHARLPSVVLENIGSGNYAGATNAVFAWASQTLADAPLHVLVEVILITFCIVLIVTRKKGNNGPFRIKDPKVVDELCEEFRPEPLVSNVQVEFETEFPEGSVVDSFNGVHVNSENKDLINLS